MIAILAPYDKIGLNEFAFALAELGFDIYSTSGTQKHLAETGLPVHSISSLTGFPEILDGRVKTLHPMVHGGILARRDKPEHMDELRRSEIQPIDLVCVNLYPFRETVARLGPMPPLSSGGGAISPEVQEALENIDIGGPTMVRAAAKNFPSVLVLVDPADYDEAIDCLRSEQVPLDYRRRLAEKAFQHVARYDTAIARYLRSAHPEALEGRVQFPAELTLGFEKAGDLRYGENPHQRAAVYADDRPGGPSGLLAAERQHGLDMSYLNYFDADAAWRAACDFDEPTVVIVKHATPCGIASSDDIALAYQRAYDCDTVSPFGGIIAANRAVTWAMTEAMKGLRYDIIIAPGYEDRALERLKKRRDIRILQIPPAPLDVETSRQGVSSDAPPSTLEFRSIGGGALIQTPDTRRAEDLEVRVMTKRAPTASELAELRFAWNACRNVKSNAIVIARERATVGIGGGQPNRIWATQYALEHAGERAQGAVLASDAFFPFARNDAVELACKAGVTAIIQPGGGVRDEEAVEVCDEYGVAMIFSGTRAFRH